jgi:hypothetical protein
VDADWNLDLFASIVIMKNYKKLKQIFQTLFIYTGSSLEFRWDQLHHLYFLAQLGTG